MKTGKHGPGRPPRPPLRRDRAFRAQLARQLGVEKPPQAFHAAMQKTLLELPEELPVRYRPVRELLRRTTMAAAVLALVFLGLLGVNSTYPQITEALPGLGFVFRSINGGQEAPPPPVAEATPSPTPTPEAAPVFLPVTAQPLGEFPGDLTVDAAWTDGKTLYLDLSIGFGMDMNLAETFKQREGDLEEKTGYQLLTGIPEYSNEYDYVLPSAHVVVEGALVNENETLSFESNGAGRAESSLSLDLTQLKEPIDGAVEVQIFIPELTLTFYGEQGMEHIASWTPSFELSCKVEIDNTQNHTILSPVTDNQATLERVEYTPSYVQVEATLPNIGFCGDLLLMEESMPLGIYAQLWQEEAAPAAPKTPEDPWRNGYTMSEVQLADGTEIDLELGPEQFGDKNTFRFTFCSQGQPVRLDAPLVLTFYETPEEAGEFACRRVLAEFSIDLEKNQVFASENYKKTGNEKLDPDRKAPPLGAFLNDFLCIDISLQPMEASPTGMGEYVSLFTPYPMVGRSLAIQAYYDDVLVQQLPVTTGLPEGERFTGENGSYMESSYSLPSTGETYSVMSFWIYYLYDRQDSTGGLQRYTRLELVDLETGKTLISDLNEEMMRSRVETLGDFVAYYAQQKTPENWPQAPSSFGTESDLYGGRSDTQP